MAVIELSGIEKKYKIKNSARKKSTLTALDQVNLTVEKGEIFGLLGKNGAGKTTLIKVMAGLLEPNGGTGRILGYDIYGEHKKIRASVSLVAPTADVGTDNNLTVRQNLEFWAVVYNLEKDQIEDRIDSLLSFLDLKKYENAWPISISAGMRQRLAIARSLLVNNPLLFLDEPTVKLDAPGARSIRDFIGQINKEFGVTIILTTHLIDEAELLCGRVAIMERGKIISCDSVSHLRDNLGWKNSCTMVCSSIPAEETKSKLISHLKEVSGAAKYSFIGETLLLENSVDSSLSFEAQKILRREGINILSIQWNEPRLEEVFLTTLKKRGEL
jgi:ABC-2 type transport system ATP-binding protein